MCFLLRLVSVTILGEGGSSCIDVQGDAACSSCGRGSNFHGGTIWALFPLQFNKHQFYSVALGNQRIYRYGVWGAVGAGHTE